MSVTTSTIIRYSKAAVQDLNSGVNARRARIGVVGKFAGDWNYSLIFDFGGSTRYWQSVRDRERLRHL